MTTRTLLFGILLLLFAVLTGCGSGGGGGVPKPALPIIPSASVGQFDSLAQLPYGEDSLPEDLLDNVAESYTYASGIFAQWALLFTKCADYAVQAEESTAPYYVLKNEFIDLALACHRLSLALKARDSSAGESMAESLADALRALAGTLRGYDLSTVADKMDQSAGRADELAACIGEGLLTQEPLLDVLAADLVFRQSLVELADEINGQGAGRMTRSRAAGLYYYIVTTKSQTIVSTPVSATPWGQVSPFYYRRTVTVNRTITTVEAETSYATLLNAIWNINGFNYHELSRSVSQQQQTYSEYYFSFSTPPSDTLPPGSTHTTIISRRIRNENTTGAIGGG